jgi:hypothetical protein
LIVLGEKLAGFGKIWEHISVPDFFAEPEKDPYYYK